MYSSLLQARNDESFVIQEIVRKSPWHAVITPSGVISIGEQVTLEPVRIKGTNTQVTPYNEQTCTHQWGIQDSNEGGSICMDACEILSHAPFSFNHAHSRHVFWQKKKRVAMWVNRPVYD